MSSKYSDDRRIDSDIRELLVSEAQRINSEAFIADDPVQFPRMFSDIRDIEIVALLASTIAWGNRTMICRNCDKMLSLMDRQPYKYIMDRGFDDLPDINIHRTFFAKDMRAYLKGLHRIYSRHTTLDDFARARGIPTAGLPAWALADAINGEIAAANDGCANSRCLPLNTATTALKRLNMALRWLVRDDGIVDMGVWKCLTPAQLYIPLDVHVGNVSRSLGLLDRKSNDRKAVLDLTDTLRTLRPADPVFFDYALFGIGVTAKNKR